MKYGDAVVFLFFRDGKILVEERPVKHLGNKRAVLIPSGTVESKDGAGDERFVNALFREIGEEYGGNIRVEEYRYLSSHTSDTIRLNFVCFLITKWSGEFSDHSFEDGEKFADLFWISLEDYAKYLQFPSSRKFCRELISYLSER